MAEHIHVKAETRGPYERADRAAAFIEVCRCGAERYACACTQCKSRGTNVTRWQTRPTTSHAHQWDNYLHTAYVLVRKPLEHHCKLCSDCGKLLCEVSDGP